MSDKFDRFNQEARDVLTNAQEEARAHNNNYVAPEHLLLGMGYDSESEGSRALKHFELDPFTIRMGLEPMMSRGAQSSEAEFGLTPRGKLVIEMTVDEARRLNHHYIGSVHIFLGLVREGESIAAGYLLHHGIDLNTAREYVQSLTLHEKPESNFSEEDYDRLEIILRQIQVEHILLFVKGWITMESLIQAHYRRFGYDYINRLSRDAWVSDHFRGFCQQRADMYWKEVGQCPSLDQLLYMAANGIPSPLHVNHCPVCSPLWQIVQARGGSSERRPFIDEIRHKGGQISTGSGSATKPSRKKAKETPAEPTGNHPSLQSLRRAAKERASGQGDVSATPEIATDDS